MTMGRSPATQALFESAGDDGSRWLFIATSQEWAITRNGKQVAAGSNDRLSLQGGVAQFLTLTHPAGGATRCDPVVQRHLDRIEIENQIQLRAHSKGRRHCVK